MILRPNQGPHRSLPHLLVLWVLLAAAGGAGAAEISFPLPWRWSSPFPHGNNVIDSFYDGTLATQVTEKGQIYSSTDLSTWTRRDSGTPKALRSVTYFNGRIVITGEEGTVVWGDSVHEFTALDLGTANWLESVTASPSLAVAAGDNGAIYTSPDGIDWSLQSTPFNDWLRGVAHGNDLFVAVGENGRIASSPDGTNWMTQVSGTTRHLNRVKFIANRFWAAGNEGTLLGSLDGSTWTPVTTGATNHLYAIAGYNNNLLVAGQSEVRLTENGFNNWEDQSAVPDFPPPDWTWFNGFWSGNFFHLSGRTGVLVDGFDSTNSTGKVWTEQGDSLRNWLWQVIRLPASFVAVGDRGAILTSPRGIDWTIEIPPTNHIDTVLLGVGGTTNLIFATGSNGALLFSTNEYTEVTTTNVTTDASGMSMTNVVTNTISTLGIVWDELPSPTVNDLQGVAGSEEGRFVLCGGAGTLLTSDDDGQSWTERDSGTANFLSSVTAFPGGFVAVGDAGAIVTSPDGAAWTPRSAGVSTWIYRVHWIDNTLIAVGENGVILTSDDGISWTQQITPTNEWLNDVTHVNGMWFAVGLQGTLLSSPDAATWTLRDIITRKSLYSTSFVDERLIAVGIEGIVLRASTVPDTSPVLVADYGFESDLSLFLFTGQTDQRFILESSDDTQTWNTGPTLEFTRSDGTLVHTEFSSNLVYRIQLEAGDTRNVPQAQWEPADMFYLTPLTEAHFNATADTAGSFGYSQTNGTTFPVGSTNLSAVFLPDDPTNHHSLALNQPVVVQKAPLTVTAAEQARPFGAGNPTLTLSYSGFVNGEDTTALNELPQATTDADINSPVGEYTIEVTGGTADNYEPIRQNGTLTVYSIASFLLDLGSPTGDSVTLELTLDDGHPVHPDRIASIEILASDDVGAPVDQWTPINLDGLSMSNDSFILVINGTSGESRRFYLLRDNP